MAIDERLRSELRILTFDDLDVEEARRNAVAAGRRRVRRRRLVSSAALLTVVVALGAAALARVDDRSTSVTADGGGGAEGWARMADAPIRGRSAHTLVWTGREAIAWGGVGEGRDSFADGAAYDPVTDHWRPIASAPLAGRGYHGAVWTGTEMVVWGGADATGKGFVDGAAYDPAADRWRGLAAGPLSARFRPVMSWTGSEVLVVGGSRVQDDEARPVPVRPGAPPPQPMVDGAAYDPATDRWRSIASGPVPGDSAPWTPAAWTGQELIVMAAGPGVFDPPGLPRPAPSSGLPIAAYRPASDSWEVLPNVPVPMNSVPVLAWTATELIAVSGSSESGARGQAAAYDPSARRWEPLPTPPPARVQTQTAVWTGKEVLLAGGDGLALDPARDRWRKLPHLATPRLLEEMKVVWTGDVLVAWGGFHNGLSWDEGARYRAA